MIDFDLAELYGVTTSRLNEQVTRNRKRFPVDFMFRLTKKEAESLRSQFAISKAVFIIGSFSRRLHRLNRFRRHEIEVFLDTTMVLQHRSTMP
jgi:ORF6N domain-containing protein